ncbi:hypothetical protein STANM337S_06104 [Streptomyces tanashiensis]
MEVVVVEFGVAAVGGGIAGEGLPGLVVRELVGAARREPVLETALDQAEQLVAGRALADLVRERDELGELAEGLAGPVRVDGAGEGVGGVRDLVEVAAQPCGVHTGAREGRQGGGGPLGGREGGRLADLHGAAGRDVRVRGERVGGVQPLVAVEGLEGAAFGALLRLGGEGVRGADGPRVVAPVHGGSGDEAVRVLPVGREGAGVGQDGDGEVVLAAEPGRDGRAGDVPVGAGGREEGVVVARDGDAEDVALVGEDGGGLGGGDPGVTAGALGVHEGQSVADGGAQGAGAVGPVGGDGPVGPGVGPGVGRVQAGESEGEVALVGELVLAPVADDGGAGRVADLQSAGDGLVGERVAVHGGGVRVVPVPLEGEGGPPVVGGDRLALGGGGDLGGDGGAGVGGGAGRTGGAGVGVASGAHRHGGRRRGAGGGADSQGGQGGYQDQHCGRPAAGGWHERAPHVFAADGGARDGVARG